MDMHKLPPLCTAAGDSTLQRQAALLAERWGFDIEALPSSGLCLVLTDNHLELRQMDDPKLGAVYVDFASDALTFRRLHGGGRKEAIAKAVGIKGQTLPRVMDATAGLGRDAFVLASLGCHVDMLERSPVVAALLENGLARATQVPELTGGVANRMRLFHGVSYAMLKGWQEAAPDVIYLDPMFPHKKKSALVKKDMRLFQQLLGPDEDADRLLQPALDLALHRVVVKRPDSAPWLDNRAPHMAIKSKKHRFDVYLKHQ